MLSKPLHCFAVRIYEIIIIEIHRMHLHRIFVVYFPLQTLTPEIWGKARVWLILKRTWLWTYLDISYYDWLTLILCLVSSAISVSWGSISPYLPRRIQYFWSFSSQKYYFFLHFGGPNKKLLRHESSYQMKWAFKDL